MLSLFLFMLTFDAIFSERRIRDGILPTTNKTYVVYLIKAPISLKFYDNWLCGGALVSTVFILTSAACVADVDFIFAVAGYKKYVHDLQIDIDKCTKDMKKKVVYIASPKAYQLDYDKFEKWAYGDIALAKVESEFKLNDDRFLSICSYYPTIIPINYNGRYQEPGTDALVFGWGHKRKWRKDQETKNDNTPLMHYTSCEIISKTECMKKYEPTMANAINEFMICTDGPGILNETGGTVVTSAPTANGCNSEKKKLNQIEDVSCDIVEYSEVNDNTRRNFSEVSQVYNESTIRVLNNRSILRSNTSKCLRSTTFTRESGICQNDHGGPLVTWMGKREVLIGVATAFRVEKSSSDCIGPYLFTSTQCNGVFLNCVLHGGEKVWLNRRNEPVSCDSPPEQKGFDLDERHLSWLHHPAGPADNEKELAALRTRDNISNKTIHKELELNESYRHNVDTNFSENLKYVPNPRFEAILQIDNNDDDMALVD